MDGLKTKPLISEKLYPAKDFEVTNNHNAPREIFRNNTTAVEVIVKQIGNKNKNCVPVNNAANNKLHNLYADIEILQKEVITAKKHLIETKQCFQIVLREFKKQLEAANQRDLRRQTQNVLLQLHKEKLKTLLDSKSNLVGKLKKELLTMRRLLKFVIKGIQFTHEVDSDCEYSEFEKDLKRSASLKYTKAVGLESLTFDF